MTCNSGINVNRRTAIALALAAVGAACAAPPAPETTVALTLKGGADMNGARPAKVKVYYLLAAAAFGSADFFEVFEQPQAALGADLLSVEAFTMSPGRILTASKQFDVPPAAIGVVAAFRNIDGPGWRATAPVVRQAANKVTISLAAAALTRAAQSRRPAGVAAAQRWNDAEPSQQLIRKLTWTKFGGYLVSFENKVIWNEGLFLQPHHLQQHDRYVEALIGGVATGIAPAPWGVRELAIDQSLLKLGKIAVTRCVGLTPDGALFRAPEADAHPPALDVPENVRDSVVYLAIPARRPGAMEVDLTGDPQTVARFVPHEIGVTDCQGQDPRTERLAVAKMHLRLALDLDDLSDQLVIPIARIIEVRADKQVVLDAAFIPSCTDARAATPISGFLRELEGLLSHRADALAARLGQEGAAKGVADISDFLLLIAINRVLPQIRHLQAISNAHPAIIYQLLTALAGELATFMAADKRAGEFPLYRHDDLSNTFQPVFRVLREYLSTVIEQNAIAIPIEARKYGVSVALIADKRLLTSARFVLAVKADVAIESIRRHFPSQAKLGPVEEIRQLVNSALPGIGLRPLPVAPRQIPYHAESVYFDVDPDSPYWKQMTTSGGMAVHISGDFPGLTMDLWAIRKG